MRNMKVKICEDGSSKQKHVESDANEDSSCEALLQESLQHRYVEGAEMTLADLVVYSLISHLFDETLCFHSSLHEKLPKIFEWYEKMRKESAVCNLYGHSSACVDTNTSSTYVVQLPENDGTVLDIRDPCKKKYKAKLSEISKVLDKFKDKNIEPIVSDHPCDSVSLDWSGMDLLVNPSEGDLPAARLQRKCEQLENMVAALRLVAKPNDVIVDFCAGGGHVGILAAYLLPQCQVILVENKDQSVRRAKSRILGLNLTNISIHQCNMDYFIGRFDVGICLHACGVATDLVLRSCLDQQAAFVICPCCYGKIQDTHTVTYPSSDLFKQSNIQYQDCVTLGHAADQTQAATPQAQQGKACMALVDWDRVCLAQEKGYTVTLCTLQPATCSPKNNMLIGSISAIS